METKYTVPAVTINERPDGYDFKFIIPGVSKSEVDLNVEGKTLVLKAHAKRQPPAGFRQIVSEFDYGDYAVSVDLPEMADAKTLQASLQNGILMVAVAKHPETKARKIDIA